ncbi:DUF1801 domain-containing protein [Aeromicrobium wangtongii]|uniref:DUF1801 domain-containing protein n=1 Tax=Aeromicrobium wangtongii TaxID=2969247 RepID=UPI002016E431|nr:DUF1801 domain-containing protein [Aeromicrobium wangtongii]MCL3819562.1 DUF1801 domain-containing protein [Aeromicrobium wangtongii]
MDEDSTLSKQERTAVKERAAELKKQARNSRAKDKAAADAEDVRAKIAGMPDGDRELAQRVHDIVTDVAPALQPKLYYGQPGYARNGKVVCFFRSGQQDKERYSTFGFSAQADLDEPDGVWATSYALTDPGEKAWDHLAALIRRAAQE